MLGPIIGQLLYNALDFEYTFYATALIILVPFLLVLFAVPNRLNKSAKEREEARQQAQRDQGLEVTT
jgi:MFS family permease